MSVMHFVFFFYDVHELVARDKSITFREIGRVRPFPLDFVPARRASYVKANRRVISHGTFVTRGSKLSIKLLN